jgi:hypothetical protein
MQRADGVADVAGGIGLGQGLMIEVMDGLHAELREDARAEKFECTIAGSFLQHAARGDETGVAVLPGCAGLEIERLGGPTVENAFGGYGLPHEGRNVVLRVVVLIAGGMREELADSDVVGARQVGQVLADAVIEGEFAVLDGEQDCGGEKLLAYRADGETHGRCCGGFGIEAGIAVGLGQGYFAVLHDGDRDGGSSGFGECLGYQFVNGGCGLRGELGLQTDEAEGKAE